MVSFLPRLALAILSALLFSSCALPSVGSVHVVQSKLSVQYEKIWGVDLFNINVDCEIDRRELVRRGGYYQVSELVFEEGMITPRECSSRLIGSSKRVIELIQMPENYFKHFERTDDYPRIAEVIYFMGYRPATLIELLTLGANEHVPFLVSGKIVAFGSFYHRDIAFYIDRDDKGRGVVAKPLGSRWREYNVWFAVVKRNE